MYTPTQVEEMIRETGGLPVLVGAVSTWGHLANAVGHPQGIQFGAGGGNHRDGGTSPNSLVVSIASGLPGVVLGIGSMLLYDGLPGWVRAYRDDPLGLQTRILLAERTHLIDVYRGAAFGVEDDFGNERPDWALMAEGVDANLEARSGEQEAGRAGIQENARWEAFFPPDAEIQAGDRIRVRAGFGPSVHRVDWVAPHGPTWDGRAVLIPTDEEIP